MKENGVKFFGFWSYPPLNDVIAFFYLILWFNFVISRRLTFLSFVDLEYFRMRVIQMTTDVEVKAAEKNNIDKPRDPDRTRDLFGVQLEVRRPIKYSLASSSSLIFTFLCCVLCNCFDGTRSSLLMENRNCTYTFFFHDLSNTKPKTKTKQK